MPSAYNQFRQEVCKFTFEQPEVVDRVRTMHPDTYMLVMYTNLTAEMNDMTISVGTIRRDGEKNEIIQEVERTTNVLAVEPKENERVVVIGYRELGSDGVVFHTVSVPVNE